MIYYIIASIVGIFLAYWCWVAFDMDRHINNILDRIYTWIIKEEKK